MPDKNKDQIVQAFTGLVKADREKKKHEKLAQTMLGSGNRRGSAPGALNRKQVLGTAGSLASRVGVTKRSQASAAKAKPKPNVNDQWIHDMHNEGGRGRSAPPRSEPAAQPNRSQRLLDTLQRGNGASSFNMRQTSSISIKGLAFAGPFVVIGSNFAPGTTAEDIKEAIKPFSGPIVNCKIMSTKPAVVAEIVLQERDGAQNVIDTFNNQTADGRMLYLYMKQGGPSPDMKRELAAQQAVPSPAVVEEVESMDVEDTQPQTQVRQPQEQLEQQQAPQQPQQQSRPRPPQQPRYDDRYYNERQGGGYRSDYYGRGQDYRGGGGGGRGGGYSNNNGYNQGYSYRR